MAIWTGGASSISPFSGGPLSGAISNSAAANTTANGPAGEHLPALKVVYAETDGKIYLADHGVPAQEFQILGIVVSDCLVGNNCTIITEGKVPGMGASPGVVYWVGSGGDLVTSAPGTGFQKVVGVGCPNGSLELSLDSSTAGTGGGGGSSSGHNSGTIVSPTNTIPALSHVPISGSLDFSVNGHDFTEGTHYTITSNVITTADLMEVGDEWDALYQY